MTRPRIRSSRAAIPSGAWVAATIMPAAARDVAHQAGEQGLADVERRGRLVEQPDRPPTASSRAIDNRRRWPADSMPPAVGGVPVRPP